MPSQSSTQAKSASSDVEMVNNISGLPGEHRNGSRTLEKPGDQEEQNDVDGDDSAEARPGKVEEQSKVQKISVAEAEMREKVHTMLFGKEKR